MVEDAEAKQGWLLQKAEAAVEAYARRVEDHLGWQHEGQQLSEEPAVFLDELGVHPLDLELAPVDSRARAGAKEAENGDEAGPVGLDCDQGFSSQPCRELGEFVGNLLDQAQVAVCS